MAVSYCFHNFSSFTDFRREKLLVLRIDFWVQIISPSLNTHYFLMKRGEPLFLDKKKEVAGKRVRIFHIKRLYSFSTVSYKKRFGKRGKICMVLLVNPQYFKMQREGGRGKCSVEIFHICDIKQFYTFSQNQLLYH